MRTFSLILLTLLGVLAAAPACSQDASGRVQSELDMTDQRIERAQTIVLGSGNDAADLELTTARRGQDRARSEFLAAHYRIALDLTLQARGHADRAIALVRGLPDPDRVITQLERTRELLSRARDRIEECTNERARAMLQVGLEMQQRAEDAARAGRYLAAFQLTMSARERGLKALRACNMDENVRDSAERALKRSDEILVRAQERVTDGSTDLARQSLARARDLQDRAYADFRGEHFESALRFTLSARALGFRAIRLAGS